MQVVCALGTERNHINLTQLRNKERKTEKDSDRKQVRKERKKKKKDRKKKESCEERKRKCSQKEKKKTEIEKEMGEIMELPLCVLCTLD